MARSDSRAAEAMATYFSAWRAKDLAAFRAVLADDVSFVGPLGTASGAEGCAAAIGRLRERLTDIVVLKTFVDGDDVLTWFELHTAAAPPLPVANWSQVQDGKVKRVRVTFDPRPLVT
jgi:ketosteroid isomerase-like protein